MLWMDVPVYKFATVPKSPKYVTIYTHHLQVAHFGKVIDDLIHILSLHWILKNISYFNVWQYNSLCFHHPLQA